MLIIVVFIALLMGTRSDPEGDVFTGKTEPKVLRISSLSGFTEMRGGGGSKDVPEKPYSGEAIMFQNDCCTFNE